MNGIASGNPLPPAKKLYELYDSETDLAFSSLAKLGPDDASQLDLAQAARRKHLTQIRWTMGVVGLLTVAANAFNLATIRENVEQALWKQGVQQLPPDLNDLMLLDETVAVIFMVLGVVFIALGFAAKFHPGLCTTVGLILYILGIAVGAFFEPASITRGIIFKVIVVLALLRAIGALRGHENEQTYKSTAD